MRIAMWFAVLVVLNMSSTARAETIHLYAAGSLRAALSELAKAFEAESKTSVQAKFGPSGLLKDEIMGGGKVDVFASANMRHPQELNQAKRSGPVLLFARNKLCALARPGLNVDSGSLLDRMLDPAVKLGISTPKADPSGDYALEVFRRAEAVKPGAQAMLERKALPLTGGADSTPPPVGVSAYGWHIAEGRADVFLAYCTATRDAREQNPGQQIVQLPEALAIGADYGMTVMTGASPVAWQFAEFVLSSAGQKILAAHGFAPGQSMPSRSPTAAP